MGVGDIHIYPFFLLHPALLLCRCHLRAVCLLAACIWLDDDDDDDDDNGDDDDDNL